MVNVIQDESNYIYISRLAVIKEIEDNLNNLNKFTGIFSGKISLDISVNKHFEELGYFVKINTHIYQYNDTWELIPIDKIR